MHFFVEKWLKKQTLYLFIVTLGNLTFYEGGKNLFVSAKRLQEERTLTLNLHFANISYQAVMAVISPGFESQ